MRALGRGELPDAFELSGARWRHGRTVKHDFFAATGFYEDGAGRRAVLKVSRTAPFAGVPMAWLGRWLCGRELHFYRRLADLPNVPPVLGTVGPTGLVHAYVEGRPLSRDRPVPDGFFAQLRALFAEVHRRGVAYVDTNKPENILLGDDGRPHLIDFQISWDGGGRWWPARWWLRRLQAEDVYHLLKHQRRLRPDEMTPGEVERAARRSLLIRLHRLFATPVRRVRRAALGHLRAAGRILPEGSK
jgi:hypothetical protein